MSSSSLIISIDFEQYWGVWHLGQERRYGERLAAGRRAIPAILDSLEQAGVAATWAIVGLLMCTGKEEALELQPTYPSYRRFLRQPAEVVQGSVNFEESPGLYAPALVHRIISAGRHEIATHTFSHFHCLEPGPTLEDFETDLRAAQRIAQNWGLRLRSIVFPRNQYSPDHLCVCERVGLTTFRGNPDLPPYSTEQAVEASWSRRGQRLVDAYLPLVPSEALLCRPHRSHGLINVPASRLLRSASPVDRALIRLRLRRICREMTLAAENGVSYHLWWHPYNFGGTGGSQFELLDGLLAHFKTLQQRFGMQSRTMAELADQLNA